MITDLSQKEARMILSEQRIGRLGCMLGDDEPYIVPVNYYFKDNCIYIHSRFGLKIEALRTNPKACFQTDVIKNSFSWQSVVAFGEFEEITNERERETIFNELLTHFQKLTPVEALPHRAGGEKARPEETIVFRIRLRHITGKMES